MAQLAHFLTTSGSAASKWSLQLARCTRSQTVSLTTVPCLLFGAGGAQDVCNLRENVKQGYLPLVTDVTFEGIAKDYFFDMSPIAERG